MERAKDLARRSSKTSNERTTAWQLIRRINEKGEGISQGIYDKWSEHCPAVHDYMHERGLHGGWQTASGGRCGPRREH